MALAAPSNQIGLTVEVSAAAPATLDSTGFAALSYTEVYGIEMWPAITETPDDGRVTTIKEGDALPFNGVINRGTDEVPFIYKSADAGQVIVFAGKNGGPGDEHSFKLTESDGTVVYLLGILGDVMKNPVEAGTHKGYTMQFKRIATAVEV